MINAICWAQQTLCEHAGEIAHTLVCILASVDLGSSGFEQYYWQALAATWNYCLNNWSNWSGLIEVSKMDLLIGGDVSRKSILIITLKGPLFFWGHRSVGLQCLHFNLAFICVLSFQHSCYGTAVPSSGLCLDKENKWPSACTSQGWNVKVQRVGAASNQIRFEDTKCSVSFLFDYWQPMWARTWTNKANTVQRWILLGQI